ncbi:MAG: hypothetical protein WKG01_09240 [Kofleriaceae bacterium]
MTAIAGDDLAPWKVFADGTVVRVERDLADTVRIWIEEPKLRSAFGDGGTRFVLVLARCDQLRYTPLDEPPLLELGAIAASEPDLGPPSLVDRTVELRGSAGTLAVRYASLAIELDTGRELALADLRQAAITGRRH